MYILVFMLPEQYLIQYLQLEGAHRGVVAAGHSGIRRVELMLEELSRRLDARGMIGGQDVVDQLVAGRVHDPGCRRPGGGDSRGDGGVKGTRNEPAG